ncbi:phosphopantothenoylcysteine decarboxylase [Pilibacter termitis]|uniref:Phosphopantothenoylcysteine decarboxylase n=1 Tax=Pilibacter termitis TaxID=263852 RepID=A0A1T4K297_9ENTE|nr:phosphopantothenoylcysteine decarboxylase [Pilibacter termitis]SJZ36576.1 phosphopantothenoylcysteine decarboxylase [Pilibacter termitis]
MKNDKKTILLGVSGSISAYKAADIANGLTKLGFHVEVVMTRSAQAFITPLTLQVLSKNHVHVDVLEEVETTKVNHIELAKNTDLLIVAPASANIIGKLANGIADDMLSTVALAVRDEVPKLIAPAMNTQMYANKIVQRNLNTLKELDWKEIEPREAMLACGDVGRGALEEVEKILSIVRKEI